ncbi:PCYCGC domain-containing protein [Sutcliffiella deserti]|uniref:PCYCGC domain-containing protein n=1 Tax=Sutcliffiella deserti TaxID=2875501 RepID=UPI001CBBC205|nr:PCYCGC domain-containing protein [Sutcliffiella deserti]
MKIMVLPIITMLFLAGCSNDSQSTTNEQSQNEESHQHEKPSFYQGDIREETSSVSELPSFLNNKSEEINLIYSAAAQHQELLEHIPCYCGCGTSVGHKSSFECFVHEVNEDGTIEWDDHGTRCGVCLEIAATSVLEYKEGKSIKEIRTLIDDLYKEGFSTPTPTPMPPSD